VLLYLNTRSTVKTIIVLLAVPFSLVGSFWFLWMLGYNMSIAVWVGLIALAGLDAETGVVMLLYLDLAHDKWQKEGRMNTVQNLKDAIMEGAVKRVRPKLMTVAVILAGLVPIMFSHGAGRRRDEAHRSTHGRRRHHLGDPGAYGLPGDLPALEEAGAERDVGEKRPSH